MIFLSPHRDVPSFKHQPFISDHFLKFVLLLDVHSFQYLVTRSEEPLTINTNYLVLRYRYGFLSHSNHIHLFTFEANRRSTTLNRV